MNVAGRLAADRCIALMWGYTIAVNPMVKVNYPTASALRLAYHLYRVLTAAPET
jgi:hypothetical protein